MDGPDASLPEHGQTRPAGRRRRVRSGQRGRPWRSARDPGSAADRPIAWLMVIAAGLLEMVWSYSAKRADGLHHLGWGGITVVASLASFLLLVFAMRSLPLGTAYAVWTGIGAIGTFVVGVVLLGESSSVWRIASALLIVAGVVGLRLTSAE